MAEPDLFAEQQAPAGSSRVYLEAPRRRARKEGAVPDRPKVYYAIPIDAAVVKCSRCPADIVWVKTKAGKNMCLQWSTRCKRAVGAGLRAEPHWGFCPRAAEFKKGRPCQADDCSVVGPRLFCDRHRKMVPASIAEWIERVQRSAAAASDPKDPKYRREWFEAMRAAQMAVRKLEREQRS